MNITPLTIADLKAEGAALFEWAVHHDSLEFAISHMRDAQLRSLHLYLENQHHTGIPGLIRGLVRDAAATRFLATTAADPTTEVSP